MAYNSNYSRVIYTASAGQTLFPFNFKIFYDTDIVVYNLEPGQDPDTAVPLILNTDYTVEIFGDDGGNVTLTAGATLNAEVTLYRQLEINRFFEYQPNGDLYSDVLNNDQDYQTYLIGDIREQIDALESGGIGSESYVKRSGDTMTGKLNLDVGNTGANAIRADEVDTKIADASSGIVIDDDGTAIIKEPGGGWVKNQITAWVIFDATGDTTEDPVILDSYNISTVERITSGEQGRYFMEFIDTMDTIYYAAIVNTDKSEGYGTADALTTVRCNLYARQNGTGTWQDDIVSIIVVGGKG